MAEQDPGSVLPTPVERISTDIPLGKSVIADSPVLTSLPYVLCLWASDQEGCPHISVPSLFHPVDTQKAYVISHIHYVYGGKMSMEYKY